MFESRTSAGAIEKLRHSGKMNANIFALSHDMEGHANTNIDQLNKVSTSCIDNHQFKQEGLETTGESSKVCFQIVMKCLCL